jgi:hypothetical protein
VASVQTCLYWYSNPRMPFPAMHYLADVSAFHSLRIIWRKCIFLSACIICLKFCVSLATPHYLAESSAFYPPTLFALNFCVLLATGTHYLEEISTFSLLALFGGNFCISLATGTHYLAEISAFYPLNII